MLLQFQRCAPRPRTAQEALEHLAAAKGRLHLEGDGGGADLFYSDNRAGIPGTLHRISAMRDRGGGVQGLTYRVGRHVPGGSNAWCLRHHIAVPDQPLTDSKAAA